MGDEAWNRLLQVAKKQTGLITREQVLKLGYPKHSWDYQVRRGMVRLIHSGLYELSPPGFDDPRELQAALLCTGEGAVLSHRTAARSHGLWGVDGFPLEVSVPNRRRMSVPGVTLWRNVVGPEDLCRFQGLPMTAPVRTVLDLVPLLDAVTLAILLESARRLGKGFLVSLKERVKTFALTHEKRELLTALIEDCEQRPRAYGSVFEVQFRYRLLFMGLPPPQPQFPVRRTNGKFYYLDFAWPEVKLAVETQGYETRQTEASFTGDSSRTTELVSLG